MTLTRLAALVVFLTLATPAHAMEFSILAGTDFTRFSYTYPSETLTQSARPGLAFGAIANMNLIEPWLELESGLIFMLKRPESFDPLVDTANQQSSLRGFQIPVMARYSPFDFVSFGAGGYYTQGFDRLQRRGAATGGSEPGYSDTSTGKADFGIIASLQARVWLSYELRGLIDVRYLYGLMDVDTTGVNSKYFTDIQVMVGMTIGTFR